MSDFLPCWKLDLLDIREAVLYINTANNPLCKTSRKDLIAQSMETRKMALKPRLANSPVVDANGYCTAELADITFLEDGESEYAGEQFLFDFIAEGTQRQINLKLWSGIKINPDRYQVNGGKTKEFNKLTRVCLGLGLITESDLKTIKTEDDLDKLQIGEKLENLKGQKVRFKLLKTAKSKGGLSQIDLDTLQLVAKAVKA